MTHEFSFAVQQHTDLQTMQQKIMHTCHGMLACTATCKRLLM